jgi:hypothetical protein
LGLPFIHLCIPGAYEVQVATLERREFGSQVLRTQLALGQLGFKLSLLLALARQFLVLWLNERLSGHVARACTGASGHQNQFGFAAQLAALVLAFR